MARSQKLLPCTVKFVCAKRGRFLWEIFIRPLCIKKFLTVRLLSIHYAPVDARMPESVFGCKVYIFKCFTNCVNICGFSEILNQIILLELDFLIKMIQGKFTFIRSFATSLSHGVLWWISETFSTIFAAHPCPENEKTSLGHLKMAAVHSYTLSSNLSFALLKKKKSFFLQETSAHSPETKLFDFLRRLLELYVGGPGLWLYCHLSETPMGSFLLSCTLLISLLFLWPQLATSWAQPGTFCSSEEY